MSCYPAKQTEAGCHSLCHQTNVRGVIDKYLAFHISRILHKKAYFSVFYILQKLHKEILNASKIIRCKFCPIFKNCDAPTISLNYNYNTCFSIFYVCLRLTLCVCCYFFQLYIKTFTIKCFSQHQQTFFD